MTEPLAFLNGRLLPQSQAHLALHDAGFVFGATITDLCRTFRHRLYRWPEHLARFRRSSKMTYIDVPFDDVLLTQRAQELVEHNAALINPGADLALVMFATPGPIGYYLGQSTVTGEQPTFGMHTFPLPFARYRPWIEQGVVLEIPPTHAVSGLSIHPHIKHRSRMHWWLAEHEVQRGAQALLLDFEGYVTETASSNFLFVRNGKLLSPPREFALEGVSLGVVAELCKRLGIRLEEELLTVDYFCAVEEALLTRTTIQST